MLITFKSKAAADVTMYKEHAKRILDLLGKNADRGVITAEENAQAVSLIENEMAQSRLHSASEAVKHDVDTHHNSNGDDHDHERAQTVSFSQRAYPLLEMLRAAGQNGQTVAWGI
jgi:predicted metalloendopeptidase